MSTKRKCDTWRKGVTAKYAHAKRDGIYLRVNLYKDYGWDAYTSHPRCVTEQLLEAPCMAPMSSVISGSLMNNVSFTLHGELYCPGQRRSEVKSRLASGPLSDLRYGVFAVGGVQEVLSLIKLNSLIDGLGLEPVPFVASCGDPSKDYAKLLQHDRDVEGVVLKDSNWSTWWKWKPVRTIDLVVTGYKHGEGKYEGLVGALRGAIAVPRPLAATDVTHELVEVASVGGLTDEEREAVSQLSLGEMRGRVMEVAYQNVGANGRLVHPRFVAWRDDKEPSECGPGQDPELEEVLNLRLRKDG